MLSKATDILESAYTSKVIDKVEYICAIFLSKFIKSSDVKTKEIVQMTSLLLSYHLNNGHTCVDMKDFEGKKFSLQEDGLYYTYPQLEEWLYKLKQANILGENRDDRPLVLDSDNKLYFQKFYKFELELADKLIEKADTTEIINQETIKALNKLFKAKNGGTDYQKLAAIVALLKNICIISGSAGTGKTYTACMILALLLIKNPSYKIALSAPTGKGANRLLESLKFNFKEIKDSLGNLLKADIPDESFTIHRLLGASESKPSYFYGPKRHIPYDVVIIDEASMIDLALMVNIFRAIRKDCKIILLGDKNQLTSVEAGSVLSEISRLGDINKFSDKMIVHFKKYIDIDPKKLKGENIYKLQDCMVELESIYRQKEESKIKELSILVNRGDYKKALEISKFSNDIELHPFSNKKKIFNKINDLIDKYYTPLVEKSNNIDVKEAFKLLKKFRILTPYRKGDFGVEFINRYVEAYLRYKGLIGVNGRCYSGRPIIIHKNDYSIDLFNGDIGIYIENMDETYVYFEGNMDTYRALLPTLLPIHETAYAMTVHKAQGSEFDEALLILGDKHKELLNRQLLYTAITRAKERLYIFADENIIENAIKSPINRYSSLGKHLKVQ
ncbi:MAG: exodeoxyribonuclease V subunit alpha [Deferribacterota bacterium]|nr:exodeoxyribonuclease V subunit alpha [Deferribacterota bacterium]